MKHLLRTLAIVAITCLNFPSYAGPFGLEQGMTLEQIKKITQVNEWGNKSYFLYRAKSFPNGSNEVDIYTLLILPELGLCKVVADLKPVRTDPYGSELKAEFNLYVKLLSEKYGTSTKKIDFLHANSIWKDSKYWMRSLEQNERSLGHHWISNKLIDSLATVSVEAEATSLTSGKLSVTYDFKNMAKCQEVLEKSINKAKKENVKNF
jgi:hypothetical protein